MPVLNAVCQSSDWCLLCGMVLRDLLLIDVCFVVCSVWELLLHCAAVCAPGYGAANVASCAANAATTAICQGGWYGPPDRNTTPCLQCPAASRTFTFAYPSALDIDAFTPAVTSPPYAAGVEDCLADFAQV
jgi:hypothetical protein